MNEQPPAPPDTILRRFFRGYHVSSLIMAAVIGVLSGYGAVLFRYIILGSQFVFYGNTESTVAFNDAVPRYLFVVMPAVGGLLVGILVYWGAREAKGHGVPEVMEAVSLYGGRIRKRVAAVKILASSICIGSGGSVGREGPIVQIGSSIGSSFGQYLKVSRMQQRTLVGCGAAAGIAATFNAPIAGVLFSLEILVGDFGLTSFSPVVVSSVTATVISRYYFGNYPAFEVPAYQLESLWEFLIYPFLGILAAFVALLFIVVLYKSEDIMEKVPLPEWLRPAFGGLILGLILLKWPHVFGNGYDTISDALTNELTGSLLFQLILIKILATSVTLGTGGSGGIFAPSLFIGAMTGGVFGWLVNMVFPDITGTYGGYALVGMGAVVSGATHAPLTAILILFEMTGDYKIILPMMITCILASVITSSLKKGSIYTIKLLRRGVDISGGLEQNVLKSLKVHEFMRTDPVIIPESMHLIDMIHTFKHDNVSYLHMVNETGDLTGIISFRDIRILLDEEGLKYLVIAKDVATTDVYTISPDDDILKALKLMSERGIAQLPVVDGDENRKVVGVLTEKDLFSAYDQAVIRRELEST